MARDGYGVRVQPRRPGLRRRAVRVAAGLTTLGVLGAAAACGSADPATSSSSKIPSVSSVARSSSSPTPTRTPAPTRTRSARKVPVSSARPSSKASAPAPRRSVIVLDPGHSPTITATDPGTGLNVSDYENEPEMRDVFTVAELVRARLQAAGYQVVMTKSSPTDRVSLSQRAAIANAAHAALALSIHDQAGPNGGIGFDGGNNTVYYHSVGTFRATSSGKRIYFTDQAIAARSAGYGRLFQHEREQAEGHPVTLRGDVGYDLGTRGLAPGNIWLVQLLSHVPWIYNEAGGNSPGMSGLSSADRGRYANGLVAAVERCVPAGH
jgi:N-acetylmuramoyl-L-alanine amidase